LVSEVFGGGLATEGAAAFWVAVAGGGEGHHEDGALDFGDHQPMRGRFGPVRFLVIPNEHVPSALYLTDDHAAIGGRLFAETAKLAREKSIAETGFRLVTNAGPDANQTVLQFHLHCIGGRKLKDGC
jgi:histidine triad (HIT) family protein